MKLLLLLLMGIGHFSLGQGLSQLGNNVVAYEVITPTTSSSLSDNINKLVLSDDGYTVAVSQKSSDDVGIDAGKVRIYHWDGQAWLQKGQDLFGQFEYEYFGEDIDLSGDGQTVVIGSPHDNTFNGVRKASIYHWNGSEWLLRGIPIHSQDPES